MYDVSFPLYEDNVILTQRSRVTLVTEGEEGTYVVNTTIDTPGANPGDGIAQDADGRTSLRAAIEEANATPNMDSVAERIEFDLPGTNPHVIQVESELPSLTDALVIDATTQAGFSGAPLVEIRNIASVTNGLHLTNQGSEIRGLALTGFGKGILVGGSEHEIRDNYFGIGIDGEASANTYGVMIANSSVVMSLVEMLDRGLWLLALVRQGM